MYTGNLVEIIYRQGFIQDCSNRSTEAENFGVPLYKELGTSPAGPDYMTQNTFKTTLDLHGTDRTSLTCATAAYGNN
jgi:hypothetical protein